MFLLPIGHEEDELRRWPIVSTTIAALCLAVFALTALLGRAAENRTREAAVAVLDFAGSHPHVVPDERFLFDSTEVILEERREAWESWDWSDYEASSYGEEGPTAEEREADQRRLDELTAEWRRQRRRVPAYALGLTPAESRPATFVTYMFVHAGILHLAGNLLFFWLLASPLEDVWGRPLFAAFYLLCGLAAAALWVARYPSSPVPVIGASGAIAGLMGAFMVRFWKTRMRFFYVLWIILRIRTGTFYAPAWLMLGLWAARELAMATWIEPHTMTGGGVATWAHLYGFGFGAVAALVIRVSKIEERWVEDAIAADTGDIEERAIEASFQLEERDGGDAAWAFLANEAAKPGASADLVLRWWDLARDAGRTAEVAPALLRVLHGQLQRRELEIAVPAWLDLTHELPDFEPPADFAVRMAEALLQFEGEHAEAVRLLLVAQRALGADPPQGLYLRFVRTAVHASIPGAVDLCAKLSRDPELPEEQKRELLELVRTHA